MNFVEFRFHAKPETSTPKKPSNLKPETTSPKTLDLETLNPTPPKAFEAGIEAMGLRYALLGVSHFTF